MKKFKDKAQLGPLTRPSTLEMVGGRCLEVNHLEEGSSSSAQRATLLFKGGGLVEMDLGGGSPGAGVELVTCEAQLPGASSLLDRTSGHLQHLLLLFGGDLQAVSKTTTAAPTSVTQVVVIFVLY